ncbi:hypothetical protein QJQ45_002901 [Haematococcus lacustris]|nr:hypothetical protein QJQ45_002901 [Haematococcus lacustris]
MSEDPVAVRQDPVNKSRLGRKSKSISATYPSSNGFSSGNGNGSCVDSGQENPLHRQSLGTAVKTSVQAANAAQKAMPPSHYVRKQQQTKAEATVAAMTPLFSGVTAALSSLAQRGADKHSSGVVQAAVMATQANAVKALEYGGDSSRHFAFLQSCMQQGLAGFGLAMPTTAAGAGSSSAQHRVMEEEDACMQQGLADMTGLTSMEHARTRTCVTSLA